MVLGADGDLHNVGLRHVVLDGGLIALGDQSARVGGLAPVGPTLCSTLAHLTPTACGVQVARAWWLVIDAYCGLCPHLSVLTRCQAERSRRALGMAASPEGISTDATQPMNRDSAAAMATKSEAKDRTGRSSGLLSGWLALGCEPNLRPPPAFVYLTRLVRMY